MTTEDTDRQCADADYATRFKALDAELARREAARLSLQRELSKAEWNDYTNGPAGRIDALEAELVRLRAGYLRLQQAAGKAGREHSAAIDVALADDEYRPGLWQAADEQRRAAMAPLLPEFAGVRARLAAVHARLAGEWAELAARHLERHDPDDQDPG
jgi:hypothetical protein